MSKKAKYLPRQSIDSASFDDTYQVLGSPLPEPAYIIKIVNDSSVNVDISTDGTTDHDIAPANGFLLIDYRTNHGRLDDFGPRQGMQYYAKGATTSTGLVYLVAIGEE